MPRFQVEPITLRGETHYTVRDVVLCRSHGLYQLEATAAELAREMERHPPEGSELPREWTTRRPSPSAFYPPL